MERAWQRLIAALNERDFEAVRRLHGPGFRERWRQWHLELDLDDLLVSLEQALATGARITLGRTVALGARHGVFEMTWSIASVGAAGPIETAHWVVCRFDREGKIVLTQVHSSEADLLSAVAVLDEWYLEDEATGDEAEWCERRLALWRALLAYGEGDVEGHVAHLTDDWVLVDLRRDGFPEIRGRAVWVEWHRRLSPSASDHTLEVRSVAVDRASRSSRSARRRRTRMVVRYRWTSSP